MQFSFFFDSVDFVSKHVGIYIIQLLQFLTLFDSIGSLRTSC